ncbi:MAG: endopeptidase, partial [Actinomycetota bacterium]|nr:endopeptidase [Actinomycetota bacterium]
VIRATDLWWLLGGIVFAVLSITFGVLYPVVISPLFNKYTPLEDEALREKLLAMAQLAKADVSEILVEDSSKRDTRDNAYVAGMGKTRRVVLFDTMLDKPHEHLVSVICHEIGHWKLRHLHRTLPVAALMAFVNFAALKVIFDQHAVLKFAGVDKTGGLHNPAAIPLFLVLFGVLAKVTGLVTAWLSRSHERQADIYALELTGDWQNLQAALRNLHTQNLADLVPGLWNRLTRSHPPAAERLAMCQAFGSGRPA